MLPRHKVGFARQRTSAASCQGRSARAVLATCGSSGTAVLGCRSAATKAARPVVLLMIAAAPSAICTAACTSCHGALVQGMI